jgi:dihydrolipoamide dehydrogenase
LERFDVAIIGAGPAGYTAALHAARSGKKTAVFEKGPLGGTCLNKGCIPTKALLESASLFDRMKTASSFGIEAGPSRLDLGKAGNRTDEIVKKLRLGIEAAFKARGVALFNSHTKISDLNASDIVIASGAKPLELPDIKFDHKRVISSDDILQLREAPDSFLIIGGGAIGCEFASLYNSLGCKVMIAEMADEILPAADKEIAGRLRMSLVKKGIKIETGVKTVRPDPSFEKILVCAGRTPDTEGLGLKEAGIKTDKGRIIVNEYMQTSARRIYAAGDAANNYRLAHVASYEAMIAVDNICGRKRKADYAAVPYCVYTDPEVAGVGLTEQAAIAAGLAVKVARFPFSALGKAHVMGSTEGLLKLIGDKKTQKTLGVHIIGPAATTLIAEAALAVQKGIGARELAQTMHAHPSLPEAIMEAASIFTEVYLWAR